MPTQKAARPSLRQRLGAWILGKGVPVTTSSDAGWNVAGGAGSFATGRFGGSCVDWARRAGVLWENPAAALALSFLFDKVVEPDYILLQAVSGQQDEAIAPERYSPALVQLLALLDRPNPEYDGATLRQAIALSYKFAGNAYLVCVRPSRYAPPTELWYIPHWQMKPVAPDDGGPTREYERTLPAAAGRVTKKRYAAEDVIHFRRGIDPMNPRMGLNLFAAILRELVTDSDIATYSAALLRNFGVSAGIVSGADKEFGLEPEEASRLKTMIDARTTGDSAGSWIVSSLPLKVDPLGTSPKDMDIAKMGTRPEARVLSAFGFNPMALGLPSDDKKYANLKESRAAAWEDGIIPMLADFAQTLTAQLLPEFDPTGTLRLTFDYAGIRDLQPDEDKQSARFVAEWKAGVRKLSEARAALQLEEDVTTSADGYLWQLAPGRMDSSGGGAQNAPGQSGQETP